MPPWNMPQALLRVVVTFAASLAIVGNHYAFELARLSV
jgi:hypothetical protein